MIPDTPSSAASRMGLVEELRAWLREPDYAEHFRLLAWMNKRPVAKFYQLLDALSAKDRELAEARAEMLTAAPAAEPPASGVDAVRDKLEQIIAMREEGDCRTSVEAEMKTLAQEALASLSPAATSGSEDGGGPFWDSPPGRWDDGDHNEEPYPEVFAKPSSR